MSTLISLAALVVSIVYSRRQTALQTRLAAIEEDKRTEEVAARGHAEVTASFVQSYMERGGKRYQLAIVNNGPAVARNVSVDIAPVEGGDVVGLHTRGHELPIPSLDVGQPYFLLALVHLGTLPTGRVTLTWRDDSGPREKALTLNVY